MKRRGAGKVKERCGGFASANSDWNADGPKRSARNALMYRSNIFVASNTDGQTSAWNPLATLGLVLKVDAAGLLEAPRNAHPTRRPGRPRKG